MSRSGTKRPLRCLPYEMHHVLLVVLLPNLHRECRHRVGERGSRVQAAEARLDESRNKGRGGGGRTRGLIRLSQLHVPSYTSIAEVHEGTERHYLLLLIGLFVEARTIVCSTEDKREDAAPSPAVERSSDGYHKYESTRNGQRVH